MKSESKLVNVARQHDALTDKGAVTHSTSMFYLVDFFFLAGASRNMSENEIKQMFFAAMGESELLAMKLLFWARDARQGAGERRIFRILWKALIDSKQIDLTKLYPAVLEYGRADDLWKAGYNEQTVAFVIHELDKGNGLMAKWLPRKKGIFEAIRKELGVSPKKLRQVLVNMTNVVETAMCQKEWSRIEYGKVPSVAMARYSRAFARNDNANFTKYLEAVEKGEDKINASAVFPHDVLKEINSARRTVEAQWDALPDWMAESDEKILPLCDVSGSMTMGHGYPLPMDISLALGLYISERNNSIFKDAVMTFETSPRLIYLEGDLHSRYHQLRQAPWGGTTDLQSSFELLLNAAIKHNLSQEDMPTKLLIISDMQFDVATGQQSFSYYGRAHNTKTNYEAIAQKYAQAGYKKPDIIFWNVNGKPGNVPVSFDENGTGLVSGYSPSILKSILTGKNITPVDIMMDTVNSARYKMVEDILVGEMDNS